MAKTSNEEPHQKLRLFGPDVMDRMAEVGCRTQEDVRLDVALDVTGGGCSVEKGPESRTETLFPMGWQGVERRVSRVQGLGETALGGDQLGEAPHPQFQRLEGRVPARERGRRIGAGIHLSPEYGRDQVGATGEMPIHGPGAHACALRDVAHGRIQAGLGENRLRGVEQRLKVPARVGAALTRAW